MTHQRGNRHTNERGQTIVLVALLMVGLLAFTGLAVDGGTAFLERRRMQNAADAAAMGGARDLVMGQVFGDRGDADVLATVLHLAEANGVEDPADNLVADYVDEQSTVLGAVGGGSIPEGATGISATVQIERPARFIQVVGIDAVPAQAFSLAMVGPPGYGVNGLLPFGLPQEVFDDYVSGPIRMRFGNCLNNKGEDTGVCTLEYTTDDGENRERSHRGWFNYERIETEGSCPNAGASTLSEWMNRGWWDGFLDVGETVCAEDGAIASLFREYTTEPMCMPIYESFGDNRYLVSGFTGVRIVDAHQGQKWLDIELVSGHECHGTVGGPDFDAWSITQWE